MPNIRFNPVTGKFDLTLDPANDILKATDTDAIVIRDTSAAKKLGMKWGTNTVTLDALSVGAEELSNTGFETDLSGWTLTDISSSWWLSGGVSALNAIGVYQAKGAASQAASYVNLASPGIYDLGAPSAPTWDTSTGWRGNSSAYLTTGITPSTGWSMLVRFSGTSAANAVIAGSRKSSSDSRFYLLPNNAASGHTYFYQSSLVVATTINSGVMGIAGQFGYLDGVSEGAIGTGTNTGWFEIFIMGLNNAGTVASRISNTMYIQAVAIYNTILTAPQVAAISIAMAAL